MHGRTDIANLVTVVRSMPEAVARQKQAGDPIGRGSRRECGPAKSVCPAHHPVPGVGLDHPSEGEVFLLGQEVDQFS